MNKRFILWEGSSTPLGDRDEIIDHIISQLRTAINECKVTDTCWLGSAMVFASCIKSIAEDYGGLHCQEEDFTKFKEEVLSIYDGIEDITQNDTYESDRSFIESTFDQLIQLCRDQTG